MRYTGVVIMMFLLAGAGMGQELSSVVLSSEDEVYEAWREGEIDYQQYLILLECLAFGVTPWETYLFDDIPNLALRQPDDTLDLLTADQVRPFALTAPDAHGWGGLISHRAGVEANGEKRSRYRTSVRLSLDDRWFARLQVQREYSGRERITQRNLEYRHAEGQLRRVVVGGFTGRFGLGTVIGHRGKLLDYEARISGESWLYPDNGGYNGVLAEGKSGGVLWKGLVSQVRDTGYAISTAAGVATMQRKGIQPSVLASVTRLRNRSTDGHSTISSLGLNVRWLHRSGAIEAELAGQGEEHSSSISGVVEGSQRGAWGDIRLAGWAYSDKYSDLTGGSKAMRVYRDWTDEETAFTGTTRRAGQSGGIIKFATEPIDDWRLDVGLAYGAFNRDTSLLEISAGVSRDLSRQVALKVETEGRRARKFEPGEDGDADRQRSRLEARYRGSRLNVRGYVGYTTQTDRNDYWTVFTSLRYEQESFGLVEAWSNFGRIESGRLAYWYGFVRSEQELIEHFSVGVKLAQSYRRAEVQKRSTTIVLEGISRF